MPRCMHCGLDLHSSPPETKPFHSDLIVGRWKCAQCPDVDVCVGCLSKNDHFRQHCFLHVPHPTAYSLSGIIFVNPSMVASESSSPRGLSPCKKRDKRVWCDGCDTLITTARFVCTFCIDFDLCDLCYSTNHAARKKHASGHVFLRVPRCLTSKVMLMDISGGRLHPSLLRLLAAAPPSPVTPMFGFDKHVIARVSYADIPRVAEIEKAAFGVDGWSSHMLKSLVNPASNEFLDVIWGYPAPAKTVAAVDVEIDSTCFVRPVIMGYVGYRLKPNKSMRSSWDVSRKDCNVVSIAVHPDHRGVGLGESLLRHVITTAEMRCCTHIKLHVREDNIVAQNLYTKTGFAVYDRLPGYYDGLPSLEGSGHSLDALVMQYAIPYTPVATSMSDD